jgi:glucosamine-6-phosphate deaminase
MAGTLRVETHGSVEAMAAAAAAEAAHVLRRVLEAGQGARVVFAAAPSQSAMLAALIAEPGIDWTRVTAFHMDDYLGLGAEAPQRFSNWLDAHVFGHLKVAAFHRMPVELGAERACAEYEARLAEAPLDLGLLGIGVNGHIAFNDPPVADFDDPAQVKAVELDRVCRQQQVDDGCFSSFDQVPTHALTLTVPALMAARRIVCTVPGAHKAAAVARLRRGPIGTDAPATILRIHPDATLHIDREAANG